MAVLLIQFIHYLSVWKLRYVNMRRQFMLITGFYYLVCLAGLFFL